MKIYFSGSISGGREDAELYAEFVSALRQAGHDVLAGEVTNLTLDHEGEGMSDGDIFARDLAWLDEVDVAGGTLVAEVSRPSLGVGYEIAYARYRHEMPVICLYRSEWTKRCSAMISGDPGIRLIRYTRESRAEAMMELLRELGPARE